MSAWTADGLDRTEPGLRAVVYSAEPKSPSDTASCLGTCRARYWQRTECMSGRSVDEWLGRTGFA